MDRWADRQTDRTDLAMGTAPRMRMKMKTESMQTMEEMEIGVVSRFCSSRAKAVLG